MRSTDTEDEIAFRNGSRHVHRMQRVSGEEVRRVDGFERPSAETSDRMLRIQPSPTGLLDGLRMGAGKRCKPQRGQVEIEVRAAALNFKDLMIAMGNLPPAAQEGGYTGRALGVECAGIITALGEGVTDLAIGDPIMACAPWSLASHCLVDARLALAKPAHLTFEEAATIPAAFSTASYALNELGRLRPGERILIHAAAGGVGLAAVQIAQQIGAEIYATAGSEEKRDFLRTIGVSHVSDSRSLAFADDILSWTGGAGVDVVLNSLGGDALAVSVGLLAPYGRFVEIGKFDIYANSRLGLRALRKNQSFLTLDIDRLLAERTDFASAFCKDVVRQFRERRLFPLPHRVFTSARLAEAFRYMAQAKHIGKIVVSLQDLDLARAQLPYKPHPVAIRADATYLMAGGLGGLGLAVARWLVESGARHLVLFGRSGAATQEAQAAIRSLREEGVEVKAAQVDVSSEHEVRALLNEACRSMPPVRGVLHLAMVLDDGPVLEMSAARIRRVIAPKVQGAWNLHRLTLDMPLDFFILFSSMSALVGTPLQSSYAAANTFLDALAWFRRSRGLPALTVDWGPVSEVGHLARQGDLAQKLEAALGAKSASPRRYFSALNELLAREAVQTMIAQIDWAHLAAARFVRSLPRFSLLTAGTSGAQESASREGWVAQMLTMPVQERGPFLEQQLRRQIGRVMGIAPAKLNLDQPLLSLGLDSLMAIELKNKLALELGMEISPMQFVRGISAGQLLAMIRDHVEQLAAGRESAPQNASTIAPPPSSLAMETAATPERARELLANLDQLSDAQVEALLKVEVTEGALRQ
jgi:NADPH:quinone reductase-like Zn-dependent oxidoreductase